MAAKTLASEAGEESCFEPGGCDGYAFWTAMAMEQQNPKLSCRIIVGLPCFGRAAVLGQHLWVRHGDCDYDWPEFLEPKNRWGSLKELAYYEWKVLSPDDADPRNPEFESAQTWTQRLRDWAQKQRLVPLEIPRYP
jgi:hypothetical protein